MRRLFLLTIAFTFALLVLIWGIIGVKEADNWSGFVAIALSLLGSGAVARLE